MSKGKQSKLSKAERDRRTEKRRRAEEDALVQDTIAQMGCVADTAREMAAQCSGRLDEIDLDLTYAGLAFDVWEGRSGRATELVPLLAQLIAEHQRHAAVMDRLGQLLDELADAHEHLPLDALDPAYVRKAIFTPPEEQRHGFDRRKVTEPDRQNYPESDGH